ncbi:MAG: hypothetical protein DRJ32_03700 [Thermoprotei archaeon]|nr:MAG: hypothetical protein B6U94_08235 [Thermofilum sp. ex4484_79]RLE59962.1 MAG: hypothetical protein DRJ32_03700 [Thermoprotei archaeon]HDD64423.1 hypothetical protein [Thermoprotei archaeon]
MYSLWEKFRKNEDYYKIIQSRWGIPILLVLKNKEKTKIYDLMMNVIGFGPRPSYKSFKDFLRKMENLGLVSIQSNVVVLTELGANLANIAEELINRVDGLIENYRGRSQEQ